MVTHILTAFVLGAAQWFEDWGVALIQGRLLCHWSSYTLCTRYLWLSELQKLVHRTSKRNLEKNKQYKQKYILIAQITGMKIGIL